MHIEKLSTFRFNVFPIVSIQWLYRFRNQFAKMSDWLKFYL